MATELARTLKAISIDPTFYELWSRGQDYHSRQFRGVAKFDLNDPVEEAVYGTYKFCSNYGTHVSGDRDAVD